MLKLAIYGKGGIGKSTIASNLSAAFAERGYNVLHVGCDPKHDSIVKLVNRYNLPTLLDLIDDRGEIGDREFIYKGFNNVSCIESGGPKAGEGCAGWGILKTLEILKNKNILTGDDYDVMTFDVLGDVVCGGFAAPLRSGFGDKVVIVVSDEIMSLYAANNICHAIKKQEGNGVSLKGLLINKVHDGDVDNIEKFAKAINADIIGVIPFSRDLIEAERKNMTALQFDNKSNSSKLFMELSKKLENKKKIKSVMPLDNEEFNNMFC